MPLKEAEEKPEQPVIKAGEPGWELMHKLAAFYIAPFQHIQFCTVPSWKQLGPAPDVLLKKNLKKKARKIVGVSISPSRKHQPRAVKLSAQLSCF